MTLIRWLSPQWSHEGYFIVIYIHFKFELTVSLLSRMDLKNWMKQTKKKKKDMQTCRTDPDDLNDWRSCLWICFTAPPGCTKAPWMWRLNSPGKLWLLRQRHWVRRAWTNSSHKYFMTKFVFECFPIRIAVKISPDDDWMAVILNRKPSVHYKENANISLFSHYMFFWPICES